MWNGTRAYMRSHTKLTVLTVLALALTWGSGVAQNAAPARTEENSGAEVRLETHNGQADFKIGDPIVLDLVFTAKSPGYEVNTDLRPYLPTSDEADIGPNAGWVQTHSVFRGLGINGGLATLGSDPVRVSVLLNRTITFVRPGHYEVTLTTERLRRSGDWKVTDDACEPCRTTNAVGIDLSTRDEAEEAALVVSLSRVIEESRNAMSAGELPPEEKEKLLRETEEVQRTADSTEESKKQREALLRKLNDAASKRMAAIEKQEDARREAAVRLAYLPGDDAVRAKVHFIVDDVDPNGGNPVGPIMRDGLPSSRNKQLQLDLLESAWRDPLRVPTYQLETALRQAKELMHQQLVNYDPFGGTDEERQTALEKYRAEINEIIATLPLRTESNRAQTIDFLKSLGVPNPFNLNQRQTTGQKPN
jgi:hypothetical protein